MLRITWELEGCPRGSRVVTIAPTYWQAFESLSQQSRSDIAWFSCNIIQTEI